MDSGTIQITYIINVRLFNTVLFIYLFCPMDMILIMDFNSLCMTHLA